MLRALTDLHVRAVGIEPVLEDQRDEYPEYDELLASVMKTSVPVVMTCYLDSLADLPFVQEGEGPFSFPGVTESPVHGSGLHLPLAPFPACRGRCRACELLREGSHPGLRDLWFRCDPVLRNELARVSAGVSREGIQFDGNTVAIRSKSARIVHEVPASGSVALLYPGPLSSFTAIPFLEVLREYDRERAGMSTALPILRLQNKIVIIGPVASGRGFFVDTPVDPRLPSVLCMRRRWTMRSQTVF